MILVVPHRSKEYIDPGLSEASACDRHGDDTKLQVSGGRADAM